ncbi:MAG TPA: hypothetical protein VLF68_00020 [Candidatus Saccharimonadales bacterium]|nr:hypothetical protein [Candidatus Saccharimonadales bacterium]
MAGFGGFYKGEKKKQKKDKGNKTVSAGGMSAPTLVMPEIISKKKKTW